jgi:hypothetical protein
MPAATWRRSARRRRGEGQRGFDVAKVSAAATWQRSARLRRGKGQRGASVEESLFGLVVGGRFVSGAGTEASSVPRQQLRTKDIVRFHLPLAVTFLSYGIVFNIINRSMSRGAGAATALAAFAVGQSLVDLFAGPAGSGNQWLVARGRDRRSHAVGVRVMWRIAAGVTLLLALVGFTPAGKLLYQGIFGAPERLSHQITAVVRIAMLLPMLWAWRNMSQSALMLRRQTHFLSAGVFLRLAFVVLFSVMLGRQDSIQGAAVGAVLWIGGMATEAVFLYVVARRALAELPPEPASGVLPTEGQVLKFLLPLMATGLLWAVARPLANAAMGRTPDPELSIAAFQVGWFASFLLVALQVEYRQVMVVFWSDLQSLVALRRFGLTLSLVLGCLMLFAGLGGVAAWFMRSVLSTPEHLVGPASRVFLVSAIGPVLWMVTELQVGQLLRNGTTTFIGLAKALNLAAMGVIVFAAVAIRPSLGPLIGAIGYLGGAAVEAALVCYYGRRIAAEPLGDN